MKKLLSLILAVIMMFTCFGVLCFADGTDEGEETTVSSEANEETENQETNGKPSYSDRTKYRFIQGLDLTTEGAVGVVSVPLAIVSIIFPIAGPVIAALGVADGVISIGVFFAGLFEMLASPLIGIFPVGK